MKKLLTLLLALIILAGCGKKAPSYEDIKSEYETLKQNVIDITQNSDSFLKQDYLNVIDELKELINGIEKSTEDDNVEKLQKIYKLVYSIQTISANYDGEAAKQINNVATAIDNLIQANYDGSEEDFANVKAEIITKLDELENLSNNQWMEIEKKVLLKWADVEAEYDELATEAKQDLTEAKEVTEYELDDYKDEIINSYEEIAYGVTAFNEDVAKKMYSDAVKLKAYARMTSSDEGENVEQFADDTISYIKQCYGETVELSQDYEQTILSAKKWTQSVWNIITTELKKY